MMEVFLDFIESRVRSLADALHFEVKRKISVEWYLKIVWVEIYERNILSGDVDQTQHRHNGDWLRVRVKEDFNLCSIESGVA